MFKVLILFCIVLHAQFCYDTIGIAMLVRHGHRYSFHKRIQSSKRGQLSSLGERMNFLLGVYIKQKYQNFFDKRFDVSKFWLQASGQPRTMSSTQAFMTGLYGFNSFNEEFKENQKIYTIPDWKGFDIQDDTKTPLPKGYQGFSLKSWLRKENYQLESWSSQCPKLKQFKIANKNDTKIFMQNFQSFLPQLRDEGVDIDELIDSQSIQPQLIYDILEFVISQYYLGEYKNLSEQSAQKINILLAQFYIANLFNDEDMNKYQNTYILNNIQKVFSDIIQDYKDEVKPQHINFYFVDYHDSNLLSLLYLLKFTNFDCLQKQFEGEHQQNCFALPSYASSFIFELNKDANKFYVKFLKDGKELILCEDERGCEIEQFQDKMQDLTLEGKQTDLDSKYCFILKENNQETHPFLKFVFFFLIFMICIVGMFIFYVQKNTN